MELSKLEQAVCVLFSQNPTNVKQDVKHQAQEYLAAICSAEGHVGFFLSSLRELSTSEAKFYVLQQLVIGIKEKSKAELQEILLFMINRLRLCPFSESFVDTGCSNTGNSNSKATISPVPSELNAVKNKFALLFVKVVEQIFSKIDSSQIGGVSVGGGKEEFALLDLKFLNFRRLYHEAILSISDSLCCSGVPDGIAAVSEVNIIAKRCNCCGNQCCKGAQSSFALNIETLEMCLRVLVVLHQEVIEDVPQSPLSLAIRTAFSSDEALCVCPPAISPMLYETLQLVLRKGTPSLHALLPLCCDVLSKYVNWLDLLLPGTANLIPGNKTSDVPGSLAESEQGLVIAAMDVGLTESLNLFGLLGRTWISSGCGGAAEAMRTFVHRKMDAYNRIHLLSQMQVVEWLLCSSRILEPSMECLLNFGHILNDAVLAFLESSETLFVELNGHDRSRTNSTMEIVSKPKTQKLTPEERGIAALTGRRCVIMLFPLLKNFLCVSDVSVSSSVLDAVSLVFSKLPSFLNSSVSVNAVDNASSVLSESDLKEFVIEMLIAIRSNIASVDRMLQQQQLFEESVSISVDDPDDQLFQYREGYINCFRKACGSCLNLVFQWIVEQLQQQNPSNLQTIAATIHMLLVSADDTKSLATRLKQPGDPLSQCMLHLFQLMKAVQEQLQHPEAVTMEQKGTLITLCGLIIRVVTRFVPFFCSFQQHIPAVLEFLLSVCCCKATRNDNDTGDGIGDILAPKGCAAFLKFVKLALQPSIQYAPGVVELLLQQGCLDIPMHRSNNSSRQSYIPALIASNMHSSASRRDPVLVNPAFGGCFVEGKCFTVDQQLFLFEAVGLFLGAACMKIVDGKNGKNDTDFLKDRNASSSTCLDENGKSNMFPNNTNNATRQKLLDITKKVFQKTLKFVSVDEINQVKELDDALLLALWFSRSAAALASLSKGYPCLSISERCKTPGDNICTQEPHADAVDEARHCWLMTLKHFVGAVMASVSYTSPMRFDGVCVLFFTPFLGSSTFFSRRLLSVIGDDSVRPIAELLPAYYESLIIATRHADVLSTLTNASSCVFGTQCLRNATTLAAISEQLSSFVGYLIYAAKAEILIPVIEHQIPNIYIGHLGVYLHAVTSNEGYLLVDNQREVNDLREQLLLLVNTMTKNLPALIFSMLVSYVKFSKSNTSNCNGNIPNPQKLGEIVVRIFTEAECSSAAIAPEFAVHQQLLLRLHELMTKQEGALKKLDNLKNEGLCSSAQVGMEEFGALTAASMYVLLLHGCCSVSLSSSIFTQSCILSIQSWSALLGVIFRGERDFNSISDKSQVQLDHILQQMIPKELQKVAICLRELQCKGSELAKRPGKVIENSQLSEIFQQHVLASNLQQEVALQQFLEFFPIEGITAILSRVLLKIRCEDPQELKVGYEIVVLWQVLWFGAVIKEVKLCSSLWIATAAIQALGNFFGQLHRGLKTSLATVLRKQIPSLLETTGQEAVDEFCALVLTMDSRKIRDEIRKWRNKLSMLNLQN